MKKQLVLLTVLVIAALVSYPVQICAETKKPITIKITCNLPPTNNTSIAIDRAYAPLEKMSGGRVKVKFFRAGALAKGREAYDALLGGVADIAHCGVPHWPGRFPLINVGGMSGLFPNAVIGTHVLNELSDTTPYIKNEFKEVKVLGWWTSSLVRLILKNKITTVDEIKGLRLRSPGGFFSKTLDKLGAAGVLMGPGEIYTSMERGLLDGAPQVSSSIPSLRFHEIIDYLVENLNFGQFVSGQLMNKASWGKLPKDIQAMVESCGRNVCYISAMLYDNEEKMSFDYIRQKGVEIYRLAPGEEKKFYAAIEPIQAEWLEEMDKKGLPGKEVLNAIFKIRKKYTEKWK